MLVDAAQVVPLVLSSQELRGKVERKWWRDCGGADTVKIVDSSI